MSGIAFDRAYVELMVKNEHADLDIYSKEAARTKSEFMTPGVNKAADIVRKQTEMIDGIAHMGGIPTPPVR